MAGGAGESAQRRRGALYRGLRAADMQRVPAGRAGAGSLPRCGLAESPTGHALSACRMESDLEDSRGPRARRSGQDPESDVCEDEFKTGR